jgi:hypothetical protein
MNPRPEVRGLDVAKDIYSLPTVYRRDIAAELAIAPERLVVEVLRREAFRDLSRA